MPEGPTLSELGEAELIRRLGAFAPEGQFEDDGALLRLGCGTGVVVNTDALVEGIHFSDLSTGPGDVGWRGAVANLSDLAAMGCHQVLGITVALIAPAATPWSWVEGVYQGIQQALLRHGGVLLGGDCSAGLQRMLAITALGTLPGEAGEGGGIHRGDGRPGDLLVSTGPHGLSRLGLALLLGDRAVVALNPCLPEALVQQAVAAHRRPVPRFDAVRLLGRCRPPRLPWRVAGCDSSDGLAAAVRALALASGCGARLERSRLPMAPAMGCLPEAELWCLSGGEDFELVLALDPGWAQRLVAMLPGASVIGWLEECSGGEAVRWAGSGEPLGQQGGGFLHFR